MDVYFSSPFYHTLPPPEDLTLDGRLLKALNDFADHRYDDTGTLIYSNIRWQGLLAEMGGLSFEIVHKNLIRLEGVYGFNMSERTPKTPPKVHFPVPKQLTKSELDRLTESEEGSKLPLTLPPPPLLPRSALLLPPSKKRKALQTPAKTGRGVKSTASSSNELIAKLQKEKGLAPPPPPPEAPKTLKISKTANKSSISTAKKFFSHIPEGAFKSHLTAEMASAWSRSYKVYNLMYPYVSLLTKDALEVLAEKYYKKYNILILIVLGYDVDDPDTFSYPALISLIRSTEERLDGPQFFAVLVNEKEHQVPIICYVGPKTSDTRGRKREFLIADSVDKESDVYAAGDIKNALSKAFPTSQIFLTSKGRQIDAVSCRTESLQLAKQALLELTVSAENGMAEFLREQGKVASTPSEKATTEKATVFKVLDLPVSFDFISQIPNVQKHTEIISRQFFSKKQEKRESPFRTDKHQLKRVEEIEVLYQAWVENISLEGIEPPKGISVEKSLHSELTSYFISYSRVKKMDTYLWKKNHSLSEELFRSRPCELSAEVEE